MLLITCGKPWENLCRSEYLQPNAWNFTSHYTRISTPESEFSTCFEQVPVCRQSPQPFLPVGDSNPADDNHQNLAPLLSSKTVIKYSSHTERGRTTTPRFKRTAP
jgi:hypothetical protein